MILFCTPMYNGLCCSEYFVSALNLQEELLKNGIGHDFLITTNESLIQRARNTSVARFLTDPNLKKFTHLMFIDGDIQFKPEDVAKLWNLQVDIATAAYPMKKEGSWVSAWINGKLTKKGDLDKLKNPVRTDYTGTGFLLVKRTVFERIMQEMPEIKHEEGKVGDCWAFFDTGVQDHGKGPFYCSEDYDFCYKCRSLGFDIILEPSIKLGHVGRRVYQ